MKVLLFALCLSGLMLPATAPAQSNQTTAPDDTAQADVMISSLTATAVVASGVVEREPVGEAAEFPVTTERIYLWTLVTGATDSTEITHVWFMDTSLVQTINLPVKSSPWRTWSYKTLAPEMVGNWRVEVRGPAGEPLAEKTFTVTSQTAADSTTVQ
ncbi:MAG: DUF2914 domain-containing protein [candidate division Zixibacteria bacterium]|jgi:hypothetical protein|nr:DUF2914 domain-containing protein [candidate division Zixibacteria bacterium]